MIIFDLECDGFEPTKIHCLSYTVKGNNIKTLFDYDEMREVLTTAKILVGHNIIRFDIPVLERLLDIEIEAKLYDTLPMSWVLYPGRKSYGLAAFGEDYKIPKPEVDDWENLTLEEYGHRCEEDVKINAKLWDNLIKGYRAIYDKDKENMDRFFQYLTFKMQAAAMAERIGWDLDLDKAKHHLAELEKIEEDKKAELADYMPMVPLYEIKTPPKKIYSTAEKTKGQLTTYGRNWFDLLETEGLPKDTTEVKVVKQMLPPNPGSSDQVKDWLFSLGWQPCTFKYVKEDDGEERKIPQVRYSEPGHPRKGELTDSVMVLAEKQPAVEVLWQRSNLL